MRRKSYDNEKLAEDYFTAYSVASADRTMYRQLKEKIANCEINFFDFYIQHNNSLEELKISGIGSKTKSMLESIIANGVNKIIKERKTSFERSFHVTRPNRKFHPDGCGDDISFDRAVKNYEK